MAGRRTRWERARHDTDLLWLKREVPAAVVGGGLALAVLAITGCTDDAFSTTVISAGSAVGAAIVVPAAQLGWSYWRAPFRLLEERVDALEQSRHPGSGLAERPVSKGEVLRAATLTSRELTDYRRYIERVGSPGSPDRPFWIEQEPILAAYPGGEAAYDAVTNFYREAETQYRAWNHRERELTDEDHENLLKLYDEAIQRLADLRQEVGRQ